MKILVINPNSTASMTELIGTEARNAAAAGTRITAVNPVNSPPAIQGAEDGKAALPHLHDVFEQKLSTGEFDAVIIACFDDTGLWELKHKSPVPVIGIGEAGFHAAMLLGQRFTVVTTLGVSVPVIEQNIRDYGMAERCASVRATDIPVLQVEADPQAAHNRIADEIHAALAQEKPDAIVLGCAGMADLTPALQTQFEMPVIDGVKAAVGLCEMLHRSNSRDEQIRLSKSLLSPAAEPA